MLFQMCYGPEIISVYQMIRKYPGCTHEYLQEKFQYRLEGDIRSLLDGVVAFLEDIRFVRVDNDALFAETDEWNVLLFYRRLREIAKTSSPNSLDYVFTNLYEQLLTRPNQMFIKDLHDHVNRHFPNTLVSKEKINAWKRMMEFFGLGIRAYSGFYALPSRELMQKLVENSGSWEGPLQPFCLEKIDPYLPCVHNGQIFDGILFGLAHLDKKQVIHLSRKQDLPYNTYGPDKQWNWIEIKKQEATAE